MGFEGAAWHYARFRRGFPAKVFELLRRRFGLDVSSRVLDLGTGTGQLAVPLAAIVGEVVAADAQLEMLRELEAVAPPNVRVVHTRAEELDPALGPFRLTTIGHAFHWFERDRVLARLHPISPGLAILGAGGGHGEPWDTVAAIAAEYVGDRRPRHSGETWAEVVARSPYRTSEELRVEVEHHWTVDQVVGWTFSLSWASPALLGTRTEEFERELRRRIGPGPWVERADYQLVLSDRGE